MSVKRMGMMGTVWLDDQIADVVRATQEEIVIRFEDGQEYPFRPAKPIPLKQRSPSENWMESGALTKDQTSKAAWRLAHLQEALTGYASGDPEAAREGEPRPEYDPAKKNKTQRIKAKATEIAVSTKTLGNWERRLKEGQQALIDKRAFRPQTGVDMPEDVKQLVDEVADELESGSDITKNQLRMRVALKGGMEKLPGGSRATFNRYLDEIAKRKGLNLNAKARRGFVRSPLDDLGHLEVDRPGEVIVIDTTRVDLHGIDPVSLSWVELDLTVAMDLYTRSIVSFRFSPVSTKGVDLALMLADIVSPNPVDDRWPEDLPYPYVGVPETVILTAFNLPEGTPLKPRPTVKAETIIVDRGRNYQSYAFTMACKKLGINIQSARPRRPTDKGWIEKIFDTANQQLFQGMPGFTGPNVLARGENPEDQAIFFIWELEKIFGRWVAEIYQNRPHDGLRPVETPKLMLTPNEAYEEGVARCGFVKVPDDPDLRFHLLPIEFRQIRNDGVSIGDLNYDSPVLNPYRYKQSPHPKGKWPFRVDPRDLRRVWFQDPFNGAWHEIEWRFAREFPRPFSQEALAHTKELLASEKGRRTERDIADGLLQFHLDLQDEVKARTDRKIRKEIMRTSSTESQQRALPTPKEPPKKPKELPAPEWTTEVADLDLRHD